MRCLVLTLALAVGAFAETRMIEIPNLDKFQSTRYKIITHKYKGNNYKLVFDTKEDDFEDLFVAAQCPTGDAWVFKYEYQNERALFPKVKYPDNELNILTEAFSYMCITKVYERAKTTNQITEADKEFMRKIEEIEKARKEEQVQRRNKEKEKRREEIKEYVSADPNFLNKYNSNEYESIDIAISKDDEGFIHKPYIVEYKEKDKYKDSYFNKSLKYNIIVDSKEGVVVAVKCPKELGGYAMDLRKFENDVKEKNINSNLLEYYNAFNYKFGQSREHFEYFSRSNNNNSMLEKIRLKTLYNLNLFITGRCSVYNSMK